MSIVNFIHLLCSMGKNWFCYAQSFCCWSRLWAQVCEGSGGARPPPFHYIYHHVHSCGVRASWEGRFTPQLGLYMYCTVWSALSAGAYTTTLYVMVDIVRGGWACTNPSPHQYGLILPSWLSVRKKVAIATLCVLYDLYNDSKRWQLAWCCAHWDRYYTGWQRYFRNTFKASPLH